jgi:hypothetical protein
MRKGFEYQSLLKKACAMLSRYVLEQIAPVIPLRRYESGCIEQQVKVVASPPQPTLHGCLPPPELRLPTCDLAVRIGDM